MLSASVCICFIYFKICKITLTFKGHYQSVTVRYCLLVTKYGTLAVAAWWGNGSPASRLLAQYVWLAMAHRLLTAAQGWGLRVWMSQTCQILIRNSLNHQFYWGSMLESLATRQKLGPFMPYHEFHETCRSVTFIVVVNSHQRWKQTRNRVCFHLWCELTLALWCHSIVWSLFSLNNM